MLNQEVIKNLKVLQEIANISGEGSQQKKAALLVANDSEGMRLILRVALDPFLNTHIKQIDLTSGITTLSRYDFEHLIEDISSRKALTNELRSEVYNYVNSFNTDMQTKQILKEVLTKDVSIGMGIKSVNKALKCDLIPVVELMKAESDISIVQSWFDGGKEVFAEVKYDGVRGFAEIRGKEVLSIKTYNMRDLDIELLPHIVKQLGILAEFWAEKYPMNASMFFDFEITGKDRQSVSGEVNKVLKGTAKEGIDENWVLNVFDVQTMGVLLGVHEGRSAVYNKRRQALELIFKKAEFDNLRLADSYSVKNMKELNELMDQMLEKGEEGLVVKVGDGIYETKRSKNWIKMKAVNDCDLRIVAWFKGTGRRESLIGGFTCESEDGKIRVDVGTGFTDEVLREIAKNPDSYVGKVCAIKYNARIKKKDSEIESLFLPRFIEVRFDKQEADTIDKIK